MIILSIFAISQYCGGHARGQATRHKTCSYSIAMALDKRLVDEGRDV
jgi:hypothetical protein